MTMNPLDEKIIRFINKHHILTLASSIGNIPYCCTCFYAFDKKNCSLIFTSEADTRHHKEMLANNIVSGAIALETRIIGKIQGIQFTGTSSLPKGQELAEIRKIYLKKFPYTLPFISTSFFWKIDISHIKMTDNNLGFGKKLIWYRHSEMPVSN
jgi:uncharacterized protein YhbP (UPF0306 family)